MISFCVTCRNRLWQLKQTLAHNVASVGAEHEISLVDYGSTDGMAEWVWSNFADAIAAGRLRFFQVTNPVHWSSPRAKNLAHRISTGDYLFNLDADNWIDAADVELVGKAQALRLPCHQVTRASRNGKPVIVGDGTFGRIGMPRAMFMELGGYDESMLPMGGQDINLLERLKLLGHKIANLPAPRIRPVQNTYEQKMAEVGGSSTGDARADFAALNKLNIDFARARMRSEGPRLAGGFASFRGKLNGNPVTIDGFDVIRPDATA